MTVRTVAMLTAGGFAPCLSSAVGGLIERYSEVAPDVRIIAYRNGYAGLLTGDSVEVTDDGAREGAPAAPLRRQPDRQQPGQAHQRRGLRQARPGAGGPGPARTSRPSSSTRTASTSCTPSGATTPTARQPTSRPTCTTNGYELTVVGPAQDHRQRRGPDPAVARRLDRRRAGCVFARNIIAEHSSNPRMLIVHEVMGRNCGWLTAATARRTTTGCARSSPAGSENSPRALGRARVSSCRSRSCRGRAWISLRCR